MRSAILSLAALGVVPALAAPASVITYTSTSRTVSAQSIADTFSLSGSWMGEEFSFNPAYDGPGTTPAATSLQGGGAYATQSSLYGDTIISATLFAKAWDGNSGFGGTAFSQSNATFTLAGSTLCTISGSWSTNYNGNAGATPLVSFSLTGPGGLNYSTGFAGSVTSGTLGLSGLLAPGTYTLTAKTQYDFYYFITNAGAQSASLDYTIALPAPGSALGLLPLGAIALRRRRRA